MNLKDRLANIDANLDDLQAGVEACSRAAQTLATDTTRFDRLLRLPLVRGVVRHIKDLQAGTRDQRGALKELRASINGLQQELKRSKVLRPPPVTASIARDD